MKASKCHLVCKKLFLIALFCFAFAFCLLICELFYVEAFLIMLSNLCLLSFHRFCHLSNNPLLTNQSDPLLDNFFFIAMCAHELFVQLYWYAAFHVNKMLVLVILYYVWNFDWQNTLFVFLKYFLQKNFRLTYFPNLKKNF